MKEGGAERGRGRRGWREKGGLKQKNKKRREPPVFSTTAILRGKLIL